MKHIHRFFSDAILSSGQHTRIEPDDVFHAVKVLRLRPGDRLELAGSDGRVFEAEITGVGESVEVLAGEEIEGAAVATAGIEVVQSLPGGRKMDLIVEKLSELGVARLTPVYSEKSVARPRAGQTEKLERWRRLARASAGQSRRERVMEIDEPMALKDWLDGYDGQLLVLATETGGAPLGSVFDQLSHSGEEDGGSAGPLSLLVGPEAGFSAAEIEMLRERGAAFASLGRLVLRTETAALVAAAICMHRLGSLG